MVSTELSRNPLKSYLMKSVRPYRLLTAVKLLMFFFCREFFSYFHSILNGEIWACKCDREVTGLRTLRLILSLSAHPPLFGVGAPYRNFYSHQNCQLDKIPITTYFEAISSTHHDYNC